jgi:putative ABC transport system permease protein
MTAVGLYGLISFSVSQSTRELGIRVALGAPRGDALRLVMGRGHDADTGRARAGARRAWGLTRGNGRLLFGVGATDAVTFCGVRLLLAGRLRRSRASAGATGDESRSHRGAQVRMNG